MKRTAGINISGYISKDFGLGVAVRANINAIVAAGIPYVVNDAEIDISKEIKEGEYNIENISGENPYPVNLIQINFDNLSRFFSKKGKEYFEGKYNIGFWAWELDSLPDEALIFFKFLDEIWVPSNFCAEVISLYSTIPVVKIMHSIEPLGNLDYNKLSFGIPENRFVFLVMFDYHSTIERKNPLGAIDAYENAFG
ncbi:MAG TPA: glycosyl transferase family 2, partial [Chryseobacterium sp.]|nr:glycosyl transferase family 2 [Chryseobacterium sp.]